MSSILALPAPSSLPSSSTYGRAKALLASDAPPVTPIRAVPDEERRQQLRRAAAEAGVETTDNEANRAGGERIGGERVAGERVGGRQVGRDARRADETAQGFDAAETAAAGSQGRPNVDLQTLNAGPVAGYVAQSLYQESMGSGLHIEPWRQALGAYQRANSAGYSNASITFSV